MSFQSGISTRHWSGPLALLVEMARHRRVDLKAISMVELVNACLDNLRELARIEEKADQLLRAADLVAMKARLLMGDDTVREDEEEELRRQALKLERAEAGEVSILDVVRAYARLRLRDDVDAPMELRRILAMTLTEALEALGQRVEELDE